MHFHQSPKTFPVASNADYLRRYARRMLRDVRSRFADQTRARQWQDEHGGHKRIVSPASKAFISLEDKGRVFFGLLSSDRF